MTSRAMAEKFASAALSRDGDVVVGVDVGNYSRASWEKDAIVVVTRRAGVDVVLARQAGRWEPTRIGMKIAAALGVYGGVAAFENNGTTDFVKKWFKNTLGRELPAAPPYAARGA